jgi:thiol-disulfide isomerase/thioredoxin
MSQLPFQFLIPSIIWILIGCVSKDDKTIIHIISSEKEPTSAYVTYLNPNESIFGYDTIISDTLVNGKISLIVVNWQKTIECQLTVGEKKFPMILSPGDESRVFVSDSTSNVSGDGRNSWLFLSKLSEISDEFTSKSNFRELDPNAFVEWKNVFSNLLDDSFNQFLDSAKLDNLEQQMLETKTKLIPVTYLQNYLFIKQLYPGKMNDSIPEALRNGWDDYVLNDALFESGIVEQLMSTIWYFELIGGSVYQKFEDIQRQVKYDYDIHPLILDSMITSMDSIPKSVEYGRARNIRYHLMILGITNGTETLVHKFRNDYPKSKHLKDINEKFEKWKSIANGAKAPEISGWSIDSTKTYLSDLKGKIVFVDIWATWCPPCVEKLPEIYKLEEELKNDNIEFLFISNDRNKAKWIQYMKRENPPGINIWCEDRDQLSEDYQLFGIPRYILIDENGLILNPEVHHLMIETEIREALEII